MFWHRTLKFVIAVALLRECGLHQVQGCSCSRGKGGKCSDRGGDHAFRRPYLIRNNLSDSVPKLRATYDYLFENILSVKIIWLWRHLEMIGTDPERTSINQHWTSSLSGVLLPLRTFSLDLKVFPRALLSVES